MKGLKREDEIEDFGKKIEELSRSAIEKLTFIKTGKNWGIGGLKNTISFLENCVNLKLEDLDNRLKNVNYEFKEHGYL